MAHRITTSSFPAQYEVYVEAELFGLEDGDPCVMMTSYSGSSMVAVAMEASHARELAAALTKLASELEASS